MATLQIITKSLAIKNIIYTIDAIGKDQIFTYLAVSVPENRVLGYLV